MDELRDGQQGIRRSLIDADIAFDPDASSDLQIDAEGDWLYQGRILERERLIALFARHLRRVTDDRYAIVTPVEVVPVAVRDVPLRAERLRITHAASPEQVVAVWINDDSWLELGDAHRLVLRPSRFGRHARPYVTVRDGIDALVTRSVYYQLVEQTTDHEGRPGIWSNGVFFPLEPAADPDGAGASCARGLSNCGGGPLG